MAKKKTKVRRAESYKMTRGRHFFELYYHSNIGRPIYFGDFETADDASKHAVNEELLAPVIVEIDIPPMAY